MNQRNPNISYELLYTAIEQSPTSIVVTDKNGIILFVNAHFSKVSGYSYDEVIGQSPRILKSDFHTPEYYSLMWREISKGNTWSGLFKNKKKTGEYYWERAHINPVKDEKGTITHYVAVKRDVTNEIENKIKSDRRERLLNDIQVLSKTGGWELDVPSGNLYWTDELFELHGVPLDYEGDLLQLVQECVHPDDRDLIVESYRKCLRDGVDYDHVVKFIDRNGVRKWVRTKSRAMKDAKGQVNKIIGSVRDVTDEIDTFKAIQNSEARFKAVVSAFDDIVFTLDRQGRYMELFGHWAENAAYRSLLIGKTSEEVMGPVAGKVHMDAFKNALQGLTVTYEWSSTNENNLTDYYQTKLTPLVIEDKITGILGVGRNISNDVRNLQKLQKSELELKESLKEKETLLSEVHHRVKNNLAVISALMQLQLYSQDDPLAEEILSKSINRIKSIALIHEQLYRSERFSGISLRENIQRQTETVLDMYSDKLATKINLHLDLDEVSIDINKAMPVGLMLNEILNNTFKHAFKSRDVGNISIKLEESNDDIHIVIQDDGVGFDPSDFEDNSSSLGNTLIKTFLEQLDARYSLTTTSGTTFDIRFKKV